MLTLGQTLYPAAQKNEGDTGLSRGSTTICTVLSQCNELHPQSRDTPRGAPSKGSGPFCLGRLQKVAFELTLEDELTCPWWGRG